MLADIGARLRHTGLDLWHRSGTIIHGVMGGAHLPLTSTSAIVCQGCVKGKGDIVSRHGADPLPFHSFIQFTEAIGRSVISADSSFVRAALILILILILIFSPCVV